MNNEQPKPVASMIPQTDKTPLAGSPTTVKIPASGDNIRKLLLRMNLISLSLTIFVTTLVILAHNWYFLNVIP